MQPAVIYKEKNKQINKPFYLLKIFNKLFKIMIRKHFLKLVFQTHVTNMVTIICILNQICIHNFRDRKECINNIL